MTNCRKVCFCRVCISKYALLLITTFTLSLLSLWFMNTGGADASTGGLRSETLDPAQRNRQLSVSCVAVTGGVR